MAAMPLPSAVFRDPFAGDPARAGEWRTTSHFVARGGSMAIHDDHFVVSPIRLAHDDGRLIPIAVGMIHTMGMAGRDDHPGAGRRQASGEKRADGEGGEEDFHRMTM